jgi:hypothetical protein
MQPRPGRASAALCALMFVLTGVLGMVHEATTAHVRCALHGELVDSEAPAAAVVGPACGTIASTIAGAPLLAHGHGDEHCLLASAVRASRIAPRPPTVIAAIASFEPRATPPLDRAAPRAAGLYHIAPKTSPPA